MTNDTFDGLWKSHWQQVQQVGALTHTRYRLILKELPKSLPEDARVIDIGCGNGTFLGLLESRFPSASLHGVEMSEVACAAAAKHIRNRIVCGDVLEVVKVFTPNSFDLLICSEVLEHVPEPDQVVAAIASLLKAGGTAVFTVPAGMRHWSVQDDAANHLRRFEFDEFISLLIRHGLHVERQYAWGGPVSAIYNWLINNAGPETAATAANSALVRVLAALFRIGMRFDDLFNSKRGFQLIARASKNAPRK